MPNCEDLFIAIGPDAIGKLREKQIALLDGFGALALRNGVGLITEPDDKTLKQMQAAGFLLVKATTDELPQWVHEKLELDELRAAYSDLLNRFAPLYDAPKLIKQMSPLDAMSTRILLVHEWRRLILRQPILLHNLLPRDWPGFDCHKMVKALYPLLIEASEPWWENASDENALAHLKARFAPKA
jgi:phenylacetic acid degradation operon negative regulatory protein